MTKKQALMHSAFWRALRKAIYEDEMKRAKAVQQKPDLKRAA